MHDIVLILDFGSQYTQLIARKIRELGVYSEIHSYIMSKESIISLAPSVIILSGSPYSVTMDDSPKPDEYIWDMGVPVMGICYGMQLIADRFGGQILKASHSEYGKANLMIVKRDPIFEAISDGMQVWMSHGDKVDKVTDDLVVLAKTRNSSNAVFRHKTLPFYALQFHPEVHHSLIGNQLLHNFLFKIAHLHASWSPKSFIEESTKKIQQLVGKEKVILGLSGGVDSSVTAALIHRAIGNQLIPIFVDTGMMRFDERNRVERMFGAYPLLKIKYVDASELFLSRLKGVNDPEVKRKIIGRVFIEVFEKEASKYKEAKFLGQGTLYPDVIESVSFAGPSATIKSHHNVGGLPEVMNLELLEPLRELFKDEVRNVGREIGLPEELVKRHPFPGPGLSVRILGEVTGDKVKLLQHADEIFISELHSWGLYHETWQAFAVLLPISSVGVMGDERTYEQVCALRAVNSVDGMTAEVTELPYEFLKHVSSRICNEVRGISRVVYDISSKPPATIEWE